MPLFQSVKYCTKIRVKDKRINVFLITRFYFHLLVIELGELNEALAMKIKDLEGMKSMKAGGAGNVL